VSRTASGDAAVFALLDDLGPAVGGSGRSRLYTGFVREHCAATPAALDDAWAAVEADQRAGWHAVLLADYEWGAALHGVAPPQAASAADADADAVGAVGGLRVLMFERLEHLDADAAETWLRAQDDGAAEPSPAGVAELAESDDDDAFDAAIAAIQQAIRAGETYQVNHTYRLHGRAFGSPVALYRRLRARQPVGYGALVALPETAGGGARHVLSLSPELFLRHEAGLLVARPMKGTAPRRADDAVADAAQAAWLRADEKNRAENLMIVDLLRNDLGRIAEPGSVAVPALFALERYATVWQMTSTVQARPRPEVGLPALLRATFPCGSITGAPKRHTMGLIRRFERRPRGLYCGAIGWVDAPAAGAALGDFCLSVAIRTLTLGAPRGGLAPLVAGIGAGIVLDSVAADERAECRLKARFLTGLDPGFTLIETMRVDPDGGVPLWPRHRARLARGAARLGFALDPVALDAALQARAQALARAAAGVPHRLRLALHHDGRIDWQHAPLPPLPPGPVRLRWADERLPLERPLAGHKTSLRAAYDRGVQAAQAEGAFDSLFLREDGVLLEGGRSSVFVRLDGRWWTPPLADGVLAGVMRAELLADPAFGAAERRLTRAETERAEALVVCNALHGALPAVLDAAA
jgi:para-aminobenzoate synthetase/4-amino-4-deoxychorismate lyase